MSLHEQLRARLAGRVVVVGVGNPLRSDDAAGCRVAQRLRPRAPGRVFIAGEVPENVLFQVIAEKPDTVVFVDAVDLGSEPGAVALLESDQLSGYCPTTHRVPLRLLMEILRRETGADVFLLAIQPDGVELGSPVSGRVAAAADLLAAALEQSLDAAPPPRRPGRARAEWEIGP